jgi:HEAT repeat protein/predicted amidohydrolase
MTFSSEISNNGQLTDPDAEHRLLAVKRIGMNFNPKYIPQILNATKDPDARVREAALEALGAIGEADPVIDSVIDALKDPELKVQFAAIKVLGELRSIKAIKPLIKLIDHPDPEIRSAIAVALGHIEDKNALSPLIDLLKDEVSAVRFSALIALGNLGDTRAVEPIIELLTIPEFQSIGAITLQKFKDSRVIPPLTQLLSSPNPKARQCAILTLGSLRDPVIVPSMLGMLQDEDPDVRRAAAAALSEIKDNSTVDHFISKLKDENVEVRETSARALGKIRDQKAVKPLTDALMDPIPAVREEIARALGDLGNKDALKGLTKLLKDKIPAVRVSAIKSIGKLESEFIPGQKKSLPLTIIRSLQKCLEDPEISVRAGAAEALARIHLSQLKFDKAESYYKTASKESFIWEYNKEFYLACELGCKVLESVKKEQYHLNSPRFPQIYELLHSSAKTGGKDAFISESYWIAVEAFNAIFLSKDKDEFMRNAKDYSLRILLLNKKLPEIYRKMIEGPEEALNQKFQIIQKRGLDLAMSLQEIQNLRSDILNLGAQLLVLEPLDFKADTTDDNSSKNANIIETVIESQLGTTNTSIPDQLNLIKLATANSMYISTPAAPNFIIQELEVGQHFERGEKIQVALMQILRGAKRASLIEHPRDIFTRFVDRYYDIAAFEKQHKLKLKADAIKLSIKSKVIGLLDDAFYDGANAVIFPEFLTPWSYLDKIQEFATRYNIIIIGGMEHKEERGTLLNQAYICCPNEDPVFLKKNNPTIYPPGEKYWQEWKEEIEKTIPPVFPIIKSPLGRFTLLIGQDFTENGQYLPFIAKKHSLEFIICIVCMWQTEQSLRKFQTTAEEMGIPVLLVNSGQFGGTTVFKPNEKPNYPDILQENNEKIVWFTLDAKSSGKSITNR